ncbi:MAG: hypothetical protein CBB87_01440 [Micavibrio sp. TMED27]|nr:hypothetical protein [Micavibrio sp.]OUT92433.1 MAG: hypothetical protein CBB87_01440 [Micavibrio sp. TMED27]|tara:strand:- start:4837 stop:5952 length:1116 start_codon:yes stop_codon:yes gene_type:complete
MKIEDYQNILRHDLGSFIRFAFTELHPHADYQHNWHIDVMAHYLSLAAEGKCKRLIITMPPRMLKSHCASIALPAWMLGRDPRKRIIYLHGAKALGLELEDDCAQLMRSPRYRALFPTTGLREEKGRLVTNFGGRRQFMPIMGRLTGLGADMLIIDDPMSTTDAHDKGARMRLNRQFDENVLQRLDDKNHGAIVLVMQRLHENDLAGHLLAKNVGWLHINLPAIAMQDETWTLPHGHSYIRKKGEILHPERESKEQLGKTLISIGGYAFAYQYMQGAYKPRFGETGEGGVWLNPMREGEFYDMEKNTNLNGLFRLSELHFMLPRIFGIGEDPIPPNARDYVTDEEMNYNLARYREIMLEHQRKVASGELEY